MNSEVVGRETTLKPKQGLSGLSSRFPRETYFELFRLIRLWAKALGKKSWSIKIELIFCSGHERRAVLGEAMNSALHVIEHLSWSDPYLCVCEKPCMNDPGETKLLW